MNSTLRGKFKFLFYIRLRGAIFDCICHEIRNRIQSLEATIVQITKQFKQEIHDLKSSLPEATLSLIAKIDLFHKSLTESEDETHAAIQRLEQERITLLERVSSMVPRQDLVLAREEAKASLENAELLSHQAAKQREAASSLSDRLSLLQEDHDKLELKIKVLHPITDARWNLKSICHKRNENRSHKVHDSVFSACARRAASQGMVSRAELVAAVAEFLEGEVRAATSGAANFHALVAANALRIVERELLDRSFAEPQAGLVALGFTDEAELSAAIRAGELDGRHSEVLACLRAVVSHRLEISHPGYGPTAD